MVYLLLAAFCGALFSVIFKVCQRRGIDTMQAIFFNYVTGIVTTWAPLLIHQATGGTEVVNPFAQRWIWLALLLGFFFMNGFIVMAQSTKKCGVALTTVAARASLIIPVILSWLLLAGSAPKWIPVLLVLTALVIIAFGQGNKANGLQKSGGRKWVLFFVVFFFYGICDFSLKAVQNSISQQFGSDSALVNRQLTALTGTIFLMAALLSLTVVLLRPKSQRHPWSWKAAVAGIFLGLANLGCTTFILRSLTILPAGTFFPLYNIAIVFLGILAGLLVFKEKIKPMQYLGLLVAIVAIVLFFH